MSDPTDAELLEFVARFVGRTHVSNLPDYLHSVDAWLRDVWPKMSVESKCYPIDWWEQMEAIFPEHCGFISIANADARSRCLALYRALDGKLPDQPGAAGGWKVTDTKDDGPWPMLNPWPALRRSPSGG